MEAAHSVLPQKISKAQKSFCRNKWIFREQFSALLWHTKHSWLKNKVNSSRGQLSTASDRHAQERDTKSNDLD